MFLGKGGRAALYDALIRLKHDFDFTFKNKDDKAILDGCLERRNELKGLKDRHNPAKWFALAKEISDEQARLAEAEKSKKKEV